MCDYAIYQIYNYIVVKEPLMFVYQSNKGKIIVEIQFYFIQYSSQLSQYYHTFMFNNPIDSLSVCTSGFFHGLLYFLFCVYIYIKYLDYFLQVYGLWCTVLSVT